jgi:predicted metal-dependent phosphoesterase TrpH
MIRIDLHTHSTASPDGGIAVEQYRALLQDNVLDCIAITDHNSIDLALELHKELGNAIIVGEEIDTKQGEIIGLFLGEAIPRGLDLTEAITAIKSQGGIVYLPHPFETVRKGVQRKDLDNVTDLIDIVEVYNGRALAQNKGPEAAVWARLNQKAGAASSDAHGIRGVGTAYTTVAKLPTAQNFMKLMETGHLTMERAPIHSLLYPKLHRVRRALKRGKV